MENCAALWAGFLKVGFLAQDVWCTSTDESRCKMPLDQTSNEDLRQMDWSGYREGTKFGGLKYDTCIDDSAVKNFEWYQGDLKLHTHTIKCV